MAQASFVQVEGTQFIIAGKPYRFIGTNFWYGMNLGSEGAGGDRKRLIRELDHLKSIGINNLRIMAASEGDAQAPWRMQPSLQPNPAEYDDALWEGLDFLLTEMRKREMYAVVCLNNFWPWSGGMSQYVSWAEGSTIPYPPPAEGGNWHQYQIYTTRFYRNESCIQAAEDHISRLIKRVNSITKIHYKDDPTIMAWQLANEPRGMRQGEAYFRWIERTARFIKSLDPHHLVSVGSEGMTSVKAYANTQFREIHELKEIDYITFHLWVQNWGWYVPKLGDIGRAERKASKYIRKHVRIANQIGKPAVLEEFGISRDKNAHDPEALTSIRDRYFEHIFADLLRRSAKGQALAGCNFWAWGGEGRPREPKAIWQTGDNFIGDPPHEHQGWYSVYDRDSSTITLIRDWSKKILLLNY
ncbi:MAG: cellulase family glycosylhydrolase [Bacteroidota bacterium]